MEAILYKKIANHITDKFVEKNLIDKDKNAIYRYGFEMLISNIVYMTIFVLFSLFTNCLLESLCFWIGLFFVRKTAGGHHANSYLSCHILFASNHILFILLLKLLPTWIYYPLSFIALCFATTIVLLLAPVDHKNKAFIKNEYKRYKLLSRIYCIVLGTFLLLLTVKIILGNTYIFGYSMGTFSATISLLCAKIIRNKERKTSNEKF